MREKPTVFNYRDYEEAVAENKALRDKIANMEIKYRIAVEKLVEVDEVKEAICDHYCKWPVLYSDRGETAMVEEQCEHCPLDRL